MSSPYNPNRDADTKHANALLGLAVSMATGNPSTFIAEQERAGQAQLVTSDVLPTKINYGTRTDFEAVGFVFGEPVDGDDLFAHATLPDGWRREGSDHAMWSYIVDQLGRRRVSVFYKAAFYDRKAHMSLTSVGSYAHECLNLYGDGEPTMPVLDDQWATREAVAEALEEYAARENEDADRLEESLPRREPGNAEECRKIVVEQRARAAKARALRDRILAAED